MKTNDLLWKIYQNQNCTRTEFCKRLGYKGSQSNMSQWLNNQKELSLDQLVKFCKKLNIEIKIELNYD